MIKIFSLAVISALISVILKRNVKELVLPFQLCVGAIILIFLISEGTESIKNFTDIINSYQEEKKLLTSLIKASVIAVITKLSCDVCHESGNYLVEDIIELGGRIMIFIISMPYITQIFNVALSFAD